MDLGSSRPPQPSDRRVVNRAEPAYQPPEQPQAPRPVVEQPKTSRRAAAPKVPKEGSSKKGWLIACIVLAVAVLGLVGWLWWSGRTTVAGIDASKYQTVYLMNGQIYFGKLTAISESQYKLTNVYYLQASTTDAAAGEEATQTETNNNSQLIKLSNAIYGPEDEMVISKDQVLYFQNLNAEGRAAQLIQND